MELVIPQRPLKLMLFLIILMSSLSCQSDSASHIRKYETKTLTLPDGEKITTYFAKSEEEQKSGLSKIKPEDLKDNEAMLFTGDKLRPRQFWMPEVYFDLDLFYLSENFYVLDTHRGLKSHKTRYPEHLVPRSKTVMSVHVLEIKSSSPLAKKIHRGMLLKFDN